MNKINLKYRKKPVVIEAFQITKDTFNREWPDWLAEASRKEIGSVGSVYRDKTDNLRIVTLEGNQLISPGDYVIRGVQGEIYPCKPDIFEATYEEVVVDDFGIK